MSSIDYRDKYLKYKNKYLALKNLYGGSRLVLKDFKSLIDHNFISDIVLYDVTDISQFKIMVGPPDNQFERLVTIIGEGHLPRHTSTISGVKQVLLKSGNIAVFTMQSFIEKINIKDKTELLVETTTCLKRQVCSVNLTESVTVPNIKITGIDYREFHGPPKPEFLGTGKLYYLKKTDMVSDIFIFLDFLSETLIKNEPFTEFQSRYESDKKSIPPHLHGSHFNYLSLLLNDIENDIEVIREDIRTYKKMITDIAGVGYSFDITIEDNNDNISKFQIDHSTKNQIYSYLNTITERLKHTYKKLTDTYCIYKIFDSSDKSIIHQILLIGSEHSKNIDVMLSSYRIHSLPAKSFSSKSTLTTTYVKISDLKCPDISVPVIESVSVGTKRKADDSDEDPDKKSQKQEGGKINNDFMDY